MIRLAFLALLAFTGCAMSAAPTQPPLMQWNDLITRPRPTASATVSYGDSPYQKVDVWLPKGNGPFPVVLMVHGGCWTTSVADRTLMDWAADDLRQHGIAVWNIDYRGVDIAGGGYPGTFQDTAAAADLLRTDAARFHLKTDTIVAIGHSAGGHLALWLAARRHLPRGSPLAGGDPLPIAHVISLGGLPDLEATAASPDNGCGTDVVARLVGPPTVAHPDPYADTSVTRLLPLGVPQDLVDGREDRIIPYRLPVSYVAKARAAGDDVTLHTVPATGHVELIAPGSAAWTKARGLVMAALAHR